MSQGFANLGLHHAAVQPVGTLRDSTAVLAAFGEQLACYRSLAKMVERQHDYVQNEQTEELMSLLTERQGVLERLNAIADIVTPARSQWSIFTSRLTEDDRKKVEGMLAETKLLLASITAGDERDALVLQQRKHRLGTEIRATGAAKTVNRSYAASAYGKPKFTNVDEVR